LLICSIWGAGISGLSTGYHLSIQNVENVIEKGIKLGIFSKNDTIVTDHRKVKYGNVIFDHNIKKNRKIVHDYLDNIGIKYVGRFGEWRYLWSDQSLLSGKDIINEI